MADCGEVCVSSLCETIALPRLLRNQKASEVEVLLVQEQLAPKDMNAIASLMKRTGARVNLKPAAYCEQRHERNEARCNAHEKIPAKDKVDDQRDCAGDQALG